MQHTDPTAPVGPITSGGRAVRARAEALFLRISPYPGDGLRNHCMRVRDFVMLLAEDRDVAVDPDIVHAAAMLHDLGLVTQASGKGNYLERGVHLYRQEMADLALSAAVQKDIDEAVLYNHRVFAPAHLGTLGRLFRHAVQIEHSFGLRRFGLTKGAVRDVFGRYARKNFNTVLIDFVWRVISREPMTIIRGIFF